MAPTDNIEVVLPPPSQDISTYRLFTEEIERIVDGILEEESFESTRDEDWNVDTTPLSARSSNKSQNDVARSSSQKTKLGSKSPYFPPHTSTPQKPKAKQKPPRKRIATRNITVVNMDDESGEEYAHEINGHLNGNDDVETMDKNSNGSNVTGLDKDCDDSLGPEPQSDENDNANGPGLDNDDEAEEDAIFVSIAQSERDEILHYVATHRFFETPVQPVPRSAREQFTIDLRKKAVSAGMPGTAINGLLKYVRRIYLDTAGAPDAGSQAYWDEISFGEEFDDTPKETVFLGKTRKRSLDQASEFSSKKRRMSDRRSSRDSNASVQLVVQIEDSQEIGAPRTHHSPEARRQDKVRLMESAGGPNEIPESPILAAVSSTKHREQPPSISEIINLTSKLNEEQLACNDCKLQNNEPLQIPSVAMKESLVPVPADTEPGDTGDISPQDLSHLYPFDSMDIEPESVPKHQTEPNSKSKPEPQSKSASEAKAKSTPEPTPESKPMANVKETLPGSKQKNKETIQPSLSSQPNLDSEQVELQLQASLEPHSTDVPSKTSEQISKRAQQRVTPSDEVTSKYFHAATTNISSPRSVRSDLYKMTLPAETYRYLDHFHLSPDFLLSDSTLSEVPSDFELDENSVYPSTPVHSPRSVAVEPAVVPETPVKQISLLVPEDPKPLRSKLPKISPYFPKLPSDPQSCLPFPPIDAPYFGLVQEQLAHEPFKLLIATIFLNRTRGGVALPVLFKVFDRYPTIDSMALADESELVSMIRCLGFQNQRARKCISLAQIWNSNPPLKSKRYRKMHYPHRLDGRDIGPDECVDDEDPRSAWEVAHLPGVGAYSLDSWRIFCRDELRGMATDWIGTGATTYGFVPEWKSVLPQDKELRAYLTWLWLKEGWVWDHHTGDLSAASDKTLRAARAGGVAHEEDGNWVLETSPVKTLNGLHED
ncbi:hypothetical protein N7520_009488 [Penicillium odoratum]|uniref:uncharacterized protein n=1 Tax=Penicillium odoratum TaxID=1167516 RepID=UPI0025484843|nr:uncharacterized protein N7520_009488 [Penicillium odoratum]KAJ5752571.1 hypothetical protein N7520_009488 [Penicillium odoratum]